jgi:hypothetical protein
MGDEGIQQINYAGIVSVNSTCGSKRPCLDAGG